MADTPSNETPADGVPAVDPTTEPEPETPAEPEPETPAEPEPETPAEPEPETPAEPTADLAKKPAKTGAAKTGAAKKTAAKKTTAKKGPAKKAAAKTAARKKPAKKSAEAPAEAPAEEVPPVEDAASDLEAPATDGVVPAAAGAEATPPGPPAATVPVFQVPEPVQAPARKRRKPKAKAEPAPAAPPEEPEETSEESESELEEIPAEPDAGEAAAVTEGEVAVDGAGDDEDSGETADAEDKDEPDEGPSGSGGRRRRRRGGRRRRKPAGGDSGADATLDDGEGTDDGDDVAEQTAEDGADGADVGDAAEPGEGQSASSRRRRRRRREGEGGENTGDDPRNTVTKVRKARSPEDEITAVSGSTRLEAKKQRRREGREAGRRRAPIVSEAEFLARRESVERVMVVRQRNDLTQIGVLEDKVLVEHYVARESQTSLIGNVYLGRVQNVLPSMEAAFIDVGKGRNAVLYAGEVNWSALGHQEGTPRKIESVLQSGQTVLVQVTKDPIGHKGARLTSQISLAGRFLVYVPDGTTSGISRKLPDTERGRLKTLLKQIVPESAGVIVRTAAEGASEEELTRDVERLKARWESIEAKAGGKGTAPQLLYGEPDLTLKVVRDLFTEDFTKLVVQGEQAWETVHGYVEQVAPDLADRLEHYRTEVDGENRSPDVFATYRIDEQIAKGLDRKVWLPSGGSLIIDRTEAMTVVDVNTGKFTGSGGNLEETVTKNNLEAAEEIVRQLRLRDIGGIIVVDFIDMVLESNRELVLRRLVECLGRDRTRHQVAEVTSLGLVQMTRKRIGTGLLEAFSETCEHCHGRGLVVHDLPVEPRRGGGGGGGGDDEGRRSSRRRRGKGGGQTEENAPKPVPSPKDVAAMAKAPAPDSTSGEGAELSAEEPSGPAAVAEVPADEASVVEAPVVEAPVEEAPVEEARVEEARVEEARVEEARVEEAPVVEAPVEESPVEDALAGPDLPEPAEPAATADPAEGAPAAEPVAPADPVEPPAPTTTVVVRTRRRAASRPAGPPTPADTSADGTAPAVGTDVLPTEEEPHVEHVPIKKKGGARKR